MNHQPTSLIQPTPQRGITERLQAILPSHLPLSWGLGPHLNVPRWYTTHLPFTGRAWLAYADLPSLTSATDLAEQVHQLGHRSFLIRGCDQNLRNSLLAHGGRSLLGGEEALLDLQGNHLHKKSLKELIRRGLRHGLVRELTRNRVREVRIQRFMGEMLSHYPAPLRWLYRINPAHSQRFFGFFTPEMRLLGLLSLIPNGTRSWHTELLLRHPSAPTGVMEALVGGVFERLKLEKSRYWSLGEVPFYTTQTLTDWETRLLHGIGHSLNFVYSSQGLFHFKQKFQPIWRPVYLYGYPDLTILTLSEMFFAAECHQLVWNRIRGN